MCQSILKEIGKEHSVCVACFVGHLFTSFSVDLSIDLSTYAAAYISSLLVLMIRSKAVLQECFVIESAGFDSPVIHIISAISRLSYDCLIAIMSIIRRFLYVVPSLTRHS